MSEYKKQTGIAVTIALVGALALGVFANYSFLPATTKSSVTIPASLPSVQPLTGELSAKDVSCSLAIGVCTLTIENNSSTPLQLESCEVQVIAGVSVTTSTRMATSESITTTYITVGNGSTSALIVTPSTSMAVSSIVTETLTEYTVVNGTIGGPATTGVPAHSEVSSTCSVATTQLGHEATGSLVDGSFMLRLVGSTESYPVGAETSLGFEGSWSSPAVP